jgi:formate dehydrogenase iron-sulfur subunit
MAEKAILIDTSRCIACKGCQIACKQWNELAAGKPEFFASTDGYENPSDLSSITYTLIKFHLDEKSNGDPDWLFRKKQCMHCTEAACLESCPVSTIKRADNGFVWIDRANCIGCGTCVNVCPFGIPHLSDGTGEEDEGVTKSYKCWGCQDRQTNGEEPACVKTCAPDAQVYGDRDAMVQMANDRKAELESQGKTVYLYGIEELGGLHYIYVLLKPPSFYGLPSLSSLNSTSRRTYLAHMRELGKRYLKKVVSV